MEKGTQNGLPWELETWTTKPCVFSLAHTHPYSASFQLVVWIGSSAVQGGVPHVPSTKNRSSNPQTTNPNHQLGVSRNIESHQTLTRRPGRVASLGTSRASLGFQPFPPTAQGRGAGWSAPPCSLLPCSASRGSTPGGKAPPGAGKQKKRRGLDWAEKNKNNTRVRGGGGRFEGGNSSPMPHEQQWCSSGMVIPCVPVRHRPVWFRLLGGTRGFDWGFSKGAHFRSRWAKVAKLFSRPSRLERPE